MTTRGGFRAGFMAVVVDSTRLAAHEGEARFGDHVDSLVGRGQISDVRVVEMLGAGAVEADVVVTPVAAKIFTAGSAGARGRRGGALLEVCQMMP